MKTLTAGPEFGIQPTLDVDEYATYQHIQAGTVEIPDYVLSSDKGPYYSNLDTNGSAKVSPVFNSASPFIGKNCIIHGATQAADSPIYLFAQHKINSKTSTVKVYKVDKADLQLGVFNPRTTYIWSFNWYSAATSTYINNYFHVAYCPILGSECFFIYGQNESLVIDISTKTVKRYRFYSDSFRLSGYYPAVIFSVTQTSPTIEIYFLDLNSDSGASPTYCGTITQESNLYGVDFADPCSDGFYLYFNGTPDTSPLMLAKVINNSTGATAASKTTTVIARRVKIGYGGSFLNEQMLDPNPVTIAGSTFTFYSYYRLMQWSCYQNDTYAYLGGSKGMGGSTFKKHLIMQNSMYVEFTSVVNSGTITTVTLIPSNIPTYYEDETTPRTIANVYGAYLSFGGKPKVSIRDGNMFEFSIENGWRHFGFRTTFERQALLYEFSISSVYSFAELSTSKIMSVFKIPR